MEGMNATGSVYNTGDLVVYRNSGIYRISDVRIENFNGIGERTYYVLRSVSDSNSMIYVPVDVKDIELALRHIMSPEDIGEAIRKADCSENAWLEDVKERAEYFDRLFDEGCCSDILWLYKALSLYKTYSESIRKKLYASDVRILTAVEKIVTEELSFVLGIEKEAVADYLAERIEELRPESGA